MEKKKKLSEKQFLIICAVPVTAIMFIILYFMVFKKSDKSDTTKENKSKSSALVLPDVKDDTTKKSKSSIYDNLTEEERAKNQQQDLQSSKDFFDMNEKNVQNKKGEKQESSSLPESGTGSGNNVSYTNNNTSGKKYTGGSTAQYYQSSAPSQTYTSNSVVQKTNNSDKSDNGYSFGVYKNPAATTVKSSSDAVVQQNDYIPAILENSQNIKPGTEVIFLLQQDSYISGQNYEKMSIMYGIASFNGGRMDITINTIQDKTGQKHPVNLIGYNENYQKGVYYSDADATMKQGKSNVFSSTANGVVATTLNGSGAGGAVVNGVVQTAQGALNTSKAEVDISQGYKMYFK